MEKLTHNLGAPPSGLTTPMAVIRFIEESVMYLIRGPAGYQLLEVLDNILCNITSYTVYSVKKLCYNLEFTYRNIILYILSSSPWFVTYTLTTLEPV